MRLTHLADYAVVMMTAAARRAPGERWSASEIAGETGVPAPTAQKIMQLLTKADLLDSQRGSAGGYRLARAVPEISLADIIEAVEGPIAMTQCAETGISDCMLDQHCKVKPHMNIVGAKVRGALEAVTLEELSSSVRPEPVEGLSFTLGRKKGQDDKPSVNAVGEAAR